MSDLASIFLLSLLAMFNPTLLAAVTVMMLLPNTKKLMLGYLLGAYATSITLGLLIVFSLNDSSSVSTAKQSLSPVEDIVVGLLLLLVAFVLGGGRGQRLRERRRERKEEKQGSGEPKKSLPERMLGSGSARVTFAAGVILTFPGVSYLTALDRMAKLDAGTAATVALVVGFCLVQQLLWRCRCSATRSPPSARRGPWSPFASGSPATGAARRRPGRLCSAACSCSAA